MKVLFMVVHFLVTVVFIGGILLQTSKSEGLGALGGGSEVFRGGGSKGIEGMIERWITYLAWGFLATSFLSALLIPRFF